MTKSALDWGQMHRLLDAFRKEHGHCNVPAIWRQNPQLGRWVAVQRYKRRIGELEPQKVELLDRLGFIWSASDTAWNELYQMLLDFKKRFGHCDVPTQWRENPHLANWVANQRHRHKKGTLSPERVRRLDAAGFVWAVYRRKKGRSPSPKVRVMPTAEREGVDTTEEERLYQVGINAYVQYNGKGPMPPAVARYVSTHDGQYPPYIPLPRKPTEFRLGGDLLVPARRILWPGSGRLPAEIVEYVDEHGVLPAHR